MTTKDIWQRVDAIIHHERRDWKWHLALTTIVTTE